MTEESGFDYRRRRKNFSSHLEHKRTSCLRDIGVTSRGVHLTIRLRLVPKVKKD
jgi:hypothetical protein